MKKYNLVPDYLYCAGIHSGTEDSASVIFIDYDHAKINRKILPELKQIQLKFRLSEFFVFKTSQGYHAVCFTKVRNLAYILSCTSCCSDFFNSAHKYERVLRISQKGRKFPPRFIVAISPKYNSDRLQSLAHYVFFRLRYNIPKINGNFDQSSKVKVCIYKTINHKKAI